MGTYDSVVTVRATDAAGNVATDSHTVQIDTEVTNFARTALWAGADNVVNAAEASQGLMVTGTVAGFERGSSLLHRPRTSGGGQSGWHLVIPHSFGRDPGGRKQRYVDGDSDRSCRQRKNAD